MFANCSDEEEIYPPTVSEIADEQSRDASLQIGGPVLKFLRSAPFYSGLSVGWYEFMVFV